MQTAIVTGASQGIGRETALALAHQGYDLALVARQPERLQEVARQIQDLGRRAIAIPTDVREFTQVNSMVEKALTYLGQIDVLVNNAGVYLLGPTEACALEDWQQILNTNLWGYIHTIHALLPYFLDRKQGTIVNVSSIGGLVPLPYQVPYTTSKFAITGLTQSLHAELHPKGIQVCGVYPNFIRTNLLERAIFRGDSQESAEARRKLVEQSMQVPLLEKPQDVAQAIVHAIQHQQSEVVVGSANLTRLGYQVFPGIMQTLVRRVFGMKEVS